jgi:hypothetical protein
MKIELNKKKHEKMDKKQVENIEASEGKINPNEFKRDHNNPEIKAGHFGKKYYPYKK